MTVGESAGRRQKAMEEGIGRPGLRPVRVQAAHELVIEEIRRAVETWVYRPGGFLPAEREMSDMLGVSRNTVRMATAFLESEGFISVKRGRGGGYVVQDPALAHDRGSDIRRNPQLVLDAWDFRLTVDVGAAQLAAEMRTAADLEAMRELLAKLDEVYDDYERSEDLATARTYQALDSEFFFAMARATRNPHIIDAVMDARRRLWIAFSSYLRGLSPQSRTRRRLIFDAIADRRPEEAALQMRRHIIAGREIFEEWLVDSSLPEIAESTSS